MIVGVRRGDVVHFKPGKLLFFLAMVLSLLSACKVSGPQGSGDSTAFSGRQNLELGTRFHHVVLSKPREREIAPYHAEWESRYSILAPLRVYIEGDGRPFDERAQVALDPSPRYSPVLDLWQLDRGDAIYIGRPCYLGTAVLPECNAIMWTTGRYSGDVVKSMRRIAERHAKGRPIVFIGHSGGGTLAMLMAHSIRQVVDQMLTVITLAGNLDIEGWAAHHDYSPLSYSDNPADKLPLAADIIQLHIIGGRDKNMPGHLTKNLAEYLPPASICEVAAYDHNCCWTHRWSRFLDSIDDLLLSSTTSLKGACQVF
ncbi:MAG: hypothetical protein KUG75_00480 [Pseudomonadales bacterium]|nr:hypothetical protein [Pseudomonadales bacterium]